MTSHSKLSLVQLQQLPLSWEGFLQDFKVSVEMFAHSSRRAFLRSDTNVGHSQSLFQFIPTVSDGVEIRALCRSIKFFHTKLIQHFLFGPCLKSQKSHGQLGNEEVQAKAQKNNTWCVKILVSIQFQRGVISDSPVLAYTLSSSTLSDRKHQCLVQCFFEVEEISLKKNCLVSNYLLSLLVTI